MSGTAIAPAGLLARVAVRGREGELDAGRLVCRLEQGEGDAGAVARHERAGVVVEGVGPDVGLGVEQRLPQVVAQGAGVRGDGRGSDPAHSKVMPRPLLAVAGPVQPVRVAAEGVVTAQPGRDEDGHPDRRGVELQRRRDRREDDRLVVGHSACPVYPNASA